MRRHVLAVYVRFDTSLFSLGVTDLNYILKIIESEFVSKRLCIEMTLYRNDRTPSKLFKKVPNSMT